MTTTHQSFLKLLTKKMPDAQILLGSKTFQQHRTLYLVDNGITLEDRLHLMLVDANDPSTVQRLRSETAWTSALFMECFTEGDGGQW